MLTRLLFHINVLIWFNIIVIHFFTKDNWDITHIALFCGFIAINPIIHLLYYAILQEVRDVFPIYIQSKPEVK